MKYRGNVVTYIDWIELIAVLLIVIAGGLFSYHYIINEINDCTTKPLDYAAEKITKEMDMDFNYSYVELRVYQNYGDIVPIETIIVNKEERGASLSDKGLHLPK